MSRLRMVFCGTPQFAVPSLKILLSQPEFEILGVFTQPDRPRGRGQEMSFSPVKEEALAAGVPVHQPEKIRAPEVEQQLRALAPDAIVIIAYGQIIPARLLPIPRLGWINLHASLLPKYRGAAPIHWAIANGETCYREHDHADRRGNGHRGDAAAAGIGDRAGRDGAGSDGAAVGGRRDLMVETLRGLAAGKLSGRAQDTAQATLRRF